MPLRSTSTLWQLSTSTIVSQRLRKSLYPLGEVVNGHAFLAISETGEFFLVMDAVEPITGDAWAVFSQLLPTASHIPLTGSPS
jgi:hypothetical protein